MSSLKLFIYLISIFFISDLDVLASDIKISNVRLVNRTELGIQPYVLFDLSWENAWKNEKNHDAIWIFSKFNNYPWEHPKVDVEGHEVVKNRLPDCPMPIIKSSKDSVGIWLYLDTQYRGNVDVKLKIMLDTTSQKIDWQKTKDFQVYAIEMVYIPGGAFSLGDPSAQAEKFASFYLSAEAGKMNGVYLVESEAPIEVGARKNLLYYWSESAQYNGDQKGPIPQDFPKGTRPFYIMKYELTQGDYARFLTQLPENWSHIRNPIGGKNYHKKREQYFIRMESTLRKIL